MYSTTTIIKNSKFNGRYVGTHQRIDLAARQVLAQAQKDLTFPTGRQIIHFEGTRGPDGLKRKSPGVDEPSHMWSDTPDGKGVRDLIEDYRQNLIEALQDHDSERIAMSAAWMAHMVTDGLTPAHHFPLGEEKQRLMTSDEAFKVFGEPLKGVMRGRNWRETWKNNWQYWGFSGSMSQHISYEYGVMILAALMPIRKLVPHINYPRFREQEFWPTYLAAVDKMNSLEIYQTFIAKGWTVELASQTRLELLPLIIEMVALGWYSAIKESEGNHE